MNTRVCSICKQSWPIEYFNFKAKATGRRDTRCTPCKTLILRKWKAKHPDRVEAQKKKFRERHPGYTGRNTEENTAYFREYRRRKKEEAARAATVLANLVSALSGSIAVPEWRGEVRKVTVK